MRIFLIWLTESRTEPFDISFLSFWHILYIIIIVSATISLGIYLSKKGPEQSEKVLRILAYALVILYLGDFFVQPLFRDGEMNVDKLPFHICTVLCPVVAFTTFNKKFQKIKEPVAFLAIVAPLMYITYPGTAIGDISPFCYEILQTFIYHGVLFCWGFSMLASKTVVPNIRNCYKAWVGIVMIAVWAFIGNFTYGVPYNYQDGDPHYDWFFLTGSTFPFVPEWLMPFAVIAAVFGMVMIIYGIYYGFMSIKAKRAAKIQIAQAEQKEEITV